MTPSSKQSGLRGLWFRYLLILTAGVLLLIAGFAWYATTPSFQLMVRHRLVSELERVTGGHVELGGFHTVPFRFEIDVRDLTVHGREGPGEVPYLHVDRLLARVKLVSALGAEFGFRWILLDRPIVHIITYPDGTTNQPAPATVGTIAKAQLERLFSFSISRLDVRQGVLMWNDQNIPLDFAADDVSANLDYSYLHRRYDGNLRIGEADTHFNGYRPVPWAGEAHFGLSGDGLVVNSLKATSGRSSIMVSGRLVDFSNPSVVGKYDLNVDLAEAGAATRRPQMRAGILHLTGNGSWSKRAFSTSGQLQASELDWRDNSFRIQHAGISTAFTANPQQLTLGDLKATLLGGAVSGEAQISNWQNSSAAKRAANNDQRGRVRLAVKDISAEALASALSSAARPLSRVNATGVLSGSVETQWRGAPDNAVSAVELNVVPLQNIRPDQLPVNAHVVATYRAAPGELEVSELNASTRATQVKGSGTLSKRAALNFSVATSNFQEWQQALEALGYQERFPFLVQGRASFSGTATGKITEIALAGKLQSQNFELVIPASSGQPRRTVRWDSLTGDVQLSPRAFAMHNAVLHRGMAVIHFDADAGLTERQFTDTSPFRVRLQVRDADVTELLGIAGYQYPSSGQLNLSMQASGTRALPEGAGSLQISNTRINGEAVERVTSDFTLKRTTLFFSECSSLVRRRATYRKRQL